MENNKVCHRIINCHIKKDFQDQSQRKSRQSKNYFALIFDRCIDTGKLDRIAAVMRPKARIK